MSQKDARQPEELLALIPADFVIDLWLVEVTPESKIALDAFLADPETQRFFEELRCAVPIIVETNRDRIMEK